MTPISRATRAIMGSLVALVVLLSTSSLFIPKAQAAASYCQVPTVYLSLVGGGSDVRFDTYDYCYGTVYQVHVLEEYSEFTLVGWLPPRIVKNWPVDGDRKAVKSSMTGGWWLEPSGKWTMTLLNGSRADVTTTLTYTDNQMVPHTLVGYKIIYG